MTTLTADNKLRRMVVNTSQIPADQPAPITAAQAKTVMISYWSRAAVEARNAHVCGPDIQEQLEVANRCELHTEAVKQGLPLDLRGY